MNENGRDFKIATMTTEETPNISKEEEVKLKELFDKLDVNKDGRIDINDLTQALSTLQVPQTPGHAKVIFDCIYSF